MLITGDALAAYAHRKIADLLILGKPDGIIETLLNEEIGGAIANIGDVVAVKLTLDELIKLSSSPFANGYITHIHLNRNASKEEYTHDERTDGGSRQEAV